MHPELESHARALSAYAAQVLVASAEHARRLHAERVGVPHLLTTLMRDEDCAAHRAVVHAFGDPETIAEEAVALSEGVLVVGSGRSLPFSVRGVRALEGARGAAARQGEGGVLPEHLFLAAQAQLEPDIADDLAQAGLDLGPLGGAWTPAEAGATGVGSGPVLGGFADSTKRACGVSSRIAMQMQRDAIAPAHLLLACLEVESELAGRSGLTGLRARAALGGRDQDETPLPERDVPAESELLQFLSALQAPCDSLGLLLGLYEHGPESLRLLLAQHRLEQSELEPQLGVLRDP